MPRLNEKRPKGNRVTAANSTAPSTVSDLLARSNDDLFRWFVDSVRDYAIFFLTPEGFIASWNPGAERIKGYRAEEIIGQHFSAFYTPEALAKGWPAEELRQAAAPRQVRG